MRKLNGAEHRTAAAGKIESLASESFKLAASAPVSALHHPPPLNHRPPARCTAQSFGARSGNRLLPFRRRLEVANGFLGGKRRGHRLKLIRPTTSLQRLTNRM